MMCCMIVRADISEIPSYVPGKRLADALKLSSNEVAHPPLPTAVAAIALGGGFILVRRRMAS